MARIMIVADSSSEDIGKIGAVLVEAGHDIAFVDPAGRKSSDAVMHKAEAVIIDSENIDEAFRICSELRRTEGTFLVPVLILMSVNSEKALNLMFSAGADDCIIRPVRSGELLSRLALAVRRRLDPYSSEIPENILFAGRYKIMGVLGRGGFGTVYLAEDSRKGGRVALKILASNRISPEMVPRFLRECYSLSVLRNEHITYLIEFGSYGGKHFFAVDYIDGESLQSIIRKQGKISEAFAVKIASAMVSALTCMAEHSIIHRDIKPENIIIRKDDGVPMLVDFGIAKDLKKTGTLSSKDEMLGTPEYLAPEYIRNEKNINIKSDIYALGVTLFYAVSGTPPFKGDSSAVIYAHLDNAAPPLSVYAPEISADFCNMVGRMLIKDPRRRAGLKEITEMTEKCKCGCTPVPKKTNTEEASLDYHKNPVPGKLKIVPTKPCETQVDLSLAYSPGVAFPCMEIKHKPDTIWDYTGRGNSVAVVSDGTAVLGLGNIGAGAGLPVMEGKCILFKRFADINAIPLCIGSVAGPDGKTDAKKLIEVVKTFEPTFGGINLEDIGAPACFEVEQTLKKMMGIPVFHDDQHGTAIISLAGIMNALKLVGKKIGDCRFVMNGAGAAGIACAEYYISAGAKRENFILCDSKGTIHEGRTDLTPEKRRFALKTNARTLAEAMVGADIFMGVSVADAVTPDMVKSMAKGAIVFAMANPNPEITPDKALAAGAAVAGTGRSDYPNQVNNVLGFPGIFRGALDVRAKDINEAMKLAASQAIAEIACEKISSEIYELLCGAYPQDAANGVFDGDIPLKSSFVIPKPFDPRVVPRVAARVAEAAIKSGVAQLAITDFAEYEKYVTARIRESALNM